MATIGMGGFNPGERFNEDIPDAHCLAIGRVADAWAELDIGIDMMIW